jgi:hypothetical protein
MSLAEDETVAIFELRIGRIHAQNTRVQNGQNIGHRKAAADMGCLGGVHHPQGMYPNSPCEFLRLRKI